MTPIELQGALKKRIEKVVSGLILSSQENEEKGIQVFEQHLPRKVKSQSRNPESTFYPSIIIYLDEGEKGQVKALFIIATIDENGDNQGYKDAMNIVEKIMQNLSREPLVDGKYEIQDGFKWFYNDQDNYPYFFSWIETYWETPKIVREDVEAMI